MANTKKSTTPAGGALPANTSVVRGASLLIAMQVVSRAVTFVANQVLLRFLTAELLGVASQLEAYYMSVLFFSRESLRMAIQRQGGRSKQASGTSSPASQAAVNLAYVAVGLGPLNALVISRIYRAFILDESTADTPFLVPALYLCTAATVFELLAEPAYVVLQLQLQFGARATAESVATVLRCVTTLGTAAAFSGALPRFGILAQAAGWERPLGVLPFALGQLAYSVGLLGVYMFNGVALARRDGFALVPRRVAHVKGLFNRGTLCLFGRALFDRATVDLAIGIMVQNGVKHLLTQGDMFLIGLLATQAAQGVYALANNYGGLIARLLFQPIEESSRSYFSRLLANTIATSGDAPSEAANAATTQASRDLLRLLRLYVIASLVVVALGPAAAPPLLAAVTGPRWASSGAAAALVAYVWYVPLLAINGVAEAFVASVATEADLRRQSVWMGVFSAIFAATGYVCLRVRDDGAVGLVAANAINMACRIVWCASFVRRFFIARHVKTFSLARLLPHPLAVLAAVMARGAVQRMVIDRAPVAATAGAVAQLTQLVNMAVVSAPFVLAIVFFERKFLRQCYVAVRSGDDASA